MSHLPYKAVIIILTAVLAATAILAMLSYNALGDKSSLPEYKRLEYEWQICDLERELGYPACFIDGEFVQVKDLDESGRAP